jgi:hypothetical protein
MAGWFTKRRTSLVENPDPVLGYGIQHSCPPLAAGVLAPLGILLSPAVGALLMSISTVLVAINVQQPTNLIFAKYLYWVCLAIPLRVIRFDPIIHYFIQHIQRHRS